MKRFLVLVILLGACAGDDDPAVQSNNSTNTNSGTTGQTTAPNNVTNNQTTGNTTGTTTGSDMGMDDGADMGTDEGVDMGPPPDPLEGVGAAELIQENFQFTEGPRWFASEGVLRFTDIPANTIYELGANGNITPYRNPSGQANGLAFDAQGRLLAAEHDNRRVSLTVDGQPTTLVDRFEGKKFNSPNDLVLRSDGIVYFTDPPYGLGNRQREVAFNGLYRYVPGTQTLTVEDEGDANGTRPNGVLLSPDENLLYLADTQQGKVWVFSVSPDGSLSDKLDFATVQGPDGMAIDEWGNLYVTASNGVQVFSPSGTKLGTIQVGRQPANCAFGGTDGKTLYITAREGLYKVTLPVRGIF